MKSAAAQPESTLTGRKPRFRTPERLKPHLNLLPLLGIIPSFVLAAYSLTEPWGRARFLLVIRITQSPGAVMLVIVTLASMVAVSVSVAARARLAVAGWVHLAMGAAMCVVAWISFRMVREAGFSLLGVVPITTVRPGRGLHLWVAASILVVALGLLELAVGHLGARKRARSPATSAVP